MHGASTEAFTHLSYTHRMSLFPISRKCGTHEYELQELEALLTAYLNQNWDSMELVKAVNEPDLQDRSFIGADVTSDSPETGLSRTNSEREPKAQQQDSSTGTALLAGAVIC